VQALAACAELIGVFGQEDVTTQAADPAPEPATPAVAGVDVVANVKANLIARGISLLGSDGAFEITKRVAWALRESGIGLLDKPTGNHAEFPVGSGNFFSVDVLCYQDGVYVDMLVASGAANTPAWQIQPSAADVPAKWRAPLDPGDVGTVSTINDKFGIHNAPYPRSPWAKRGQPPFSPFGYDLRLYTGNNTFQDLIFRFPVHFLYIRALTGAVGPVVWWSALNSAHSAGEERYAPDCILQVQIDPTFVGGAAEDAQEQRTLVRIGGTNAAINATAVVYQVCAICDPAMRFTDSGALFEHGVGSAHTSNLDNERFTPEAAFVHQEQVGNTTTVRLHYKGPGHAAAALSPANAAEVASALTFAKGTLTSDAAFHTASFSQIAYFALRRDDGSGHAGVPKVLQLASFTGDGSASRTVGLSPPSGVRPAFALVVPHDAAWVQRDPSHTGTTSTQFPSTANAATGITGGGIDSISLGSILNTLGVVYDVFVIPGSATAGNGGWSVNGEFIPVEPDSPAFSEGPWDGEPEDPEAPDVPDAPTDGPIDEDELDPIGTATDYATGCVAATQQIANLALQRIGVSKRITDLVNEQTQEASAVRLTYTEDLSKTLREFPWPFATRYATLVLVAGTATVPVNGDWQYSYRVPANMMFARRIVNPAGTKRNFDADPVKFRLGADDTGQLIYTDQVGPVELEYTIRPTCAASSGDALFRDALCWRLAASLAPTLSRDAERQKFCLMMYENAKAIARVPGANEGQQDKAGDADWITGRN
jgi:hypothetical protein